MNVLIIGAGIAGLAAADRLVEHGLGPDQIRMVDKSRGVGGRMASRRLTCKLGEARFDHGAQFFTSRSSEFAALVDAAVRDGSVTEWTRGFGAEPDGHPRWRGTDAMTALAKWLQHRAGVTPELGYRIDDLGRELAERPATAVIHTAPVPQALATMAFCGLLPEPGLAHRLAQIQYQPTITVLVVPNDAPDGLPPFGASQHHDDPDHPDLAFVADNQAKGISEVPALTIHLSNATSELLWDEPDSVLLERALAAAAHLLGPAANPDRIVAFQVQRWRYAGPVACWPEPTVLWGTDPIIALAGEAFDGPKVEGAFRSGRAAADAIIRRGE
jgi:renalase